ncbi:MAG: SpoIID/LytB domain-containing protein [Syntrophomonadaceae bacterium]
MSGRRHSGARLLAAALVLLASACATPPAKPPASLPATPETPLPIPPVRVAPPSAEAPSGVLYRLGVKSDAAEFTYGTAGTVWVVVSGDRAELVQGPLVMRPSGAAAAATATFQVQAGAFSQEEPARRLADRLATTYSTTTGVAFSAERGVYRVLVGAFASRAEADAFLAKLKGGGQDGFVVPGAPAATPAPNAPSPPISIGSAAGAPLDLPSPVDVFPPAPDVRIALDGVAYRGSLRVLVNPRGLLNVVNRVDLEEYLYGVVPAEMGPKRFDAIEALKAQAVAARTYAMAHRNQFDAEGYDICPGPKCQAYGGAGVEDPLSTAAVDGTRGLVLAWQGQFADALFVSTCGGVTENVENVFSGGPVPYLVSVPCGELPTEDVAGAAVPRDGGAEPRSSLAWRGYALRRSLPKKTAAPRAASLAAAQRLAGVPVRGAPPARLTPAAVYPSLVEDFDLSEARALHLAPSDERYYAERPSAVAGLSGSARSAYEFLLRFRFAGELLPPADRDLSEEEYGGLLLSVALRLLGVTEGSGRFVSREGSNLWVKTPDGRQGLPVDPDVPLARRIGARFWPSGVLTLRPGDRLRWLRAGPRVLALWVEMEAEGADAERDSAWTEWVRRVSARELARRMSGRIAGTEVREVSVTRRAPSGRAIEMRVKTDQAEAVFKRFELRQAVEMPEMLFTVSKVEGADGQAEFVFLGRGWGHGVGLCQNGAFGMALAGQTYDRILRHYYTGIDIVPAKDVTAPAAPSQR